MKRVLIITYYWPPSGGSGVQRWLKFSRYLPEFGWEPVILTPQDPDYPVVDASLARDIPPGIRIFKCPIWEPYKLFKRFTRQDSGHQVSLGILPERKHLSIKEKISYWIRGNLFIPDSRVFWVGKAYRYIRKEFPALNIDIIISTGPPHSMHLIAMKLHRKFNTPWLADFRDPWTQVGYLRKFFLSSLAMSRHRKLERKVLINAASILTVSPRLAVDIRNLGAPTVHVVTNGFDEKDYLFHDMMPETKEFRISHYGLINSARDFDFIWEGLDELCDENPVFHEHLQVELAGNRDPSIRERILTRPNLTAKVRFEPYIAHEELITRYRSASVFLLLLNDMPLAEGYIPRKFFEYLAAGRPIVCVCRNDSDLADIINETGSGRIIGYNEKKNFKEAVMHYFNGYRTERAKQSHDAVTASLQRSSVKKYSRRNLTAELAFLLENHSVR